MSMTISMIWWS